MSFVTGMLRQTAVYWGPGTSDGYGGWIVDSLYPVEISCRWQHGEDLMVSADGETQPPNVQVFTETTVEDGGWLYLGTLADLSSAQEANPETVTGAHRIRSVFRRFTISSDTVLYAARL